MTIKNSLRKFTPKFVLDNFHYSEALYHSKKFKNPSSQMITIGIVGSKGKTTTANFIWAVLSAAGHKVGQIGTANIRIGKNEKPNPWHMTMPGAKKMQTLLSQMVKADCNFVVMEVPSEAQTQWRHIGIDFDVLVFTGVEKEIMAAHKNSMVLLHKHNKRVFYKTENSEQKIIDYKNIEKVLITNADSKDNTEYSTFNFDHRLTYSIEKPSDYRATDIVVSSTGTGFKINGYKYRINLIGQINALNGAAAVSVGQVFNVLPAQIQDGFKSLKSIPGRMEKISLGQKFLVFVDYAHDQISLTKLLDTGRELINKNNKVIVLFGGQGGGRDIKKRAEMGKIAAKLADYVVISDDDPYDDDPMQIIDDIAEGAEKYGKVKNKDLFLIQDRSEGISKALKLAKEGDLVFIACKGADQLMMVANNKSIKWDDREVTREELKKLIQ